MQRIWPKSFELDAAVPGEHVLACEPPTGYPGDCPNCGGREFVYAFYIKSGPWKHCPETMSEAVKYIDGSWYVGELKAAPCPVCSSHRTAEYLVRICGLEGPDLDLRLDRFKALPGKEKARQLAEELLALVPYPHGLVTFYGDYGVGKTMLLKILVNSYRVAGIAAVYTRMSDLLASVREGYADQAKKAAEAILAEYGAAQVLAIDEFDRVNQTPWVMETMFRLLDGRYEQAHSRMTLLATNSDPFKMAAELEYLASRITGGTVCHVGGIDVRKHTGQGMMQGELIR